MSLGLATQVKNLPKVESLCFHCGADNESVAVIEDNHWFCCEGCATVYELLKQNSLCDYYVLNQHPGIKQNTRPEYAYLDDPTISAQMLDFKDEKTASIRFILPAVHCSSCVWLLEQLFRIKEGVLRSEINFARKELRINFEPKKVSLSEIWGG